MNRPEYKSAGLRPVLQPAIQTQRAHDTKRCSALTAGVLLSLSFLLAACGNKGPLYLEVDQDTLRELEVLSQEIEQADEEVENSRKKGSAGAAGTTGTGNTDE